MSKRNVRLATTQQFEQATKKANAIIKKAGFTPCSTYNRVVYVAGDAVFFADSFESAPNTYGSPAVSVQIVLKTGKLR